MKTTFTIHVTTSASSQLEVDLYLAELAEEATQRLCDHVNPFQVTTDYSLEDLAGHPYTYHHHAEGHPVVYRQKK